MHKVLLLKIAALAVCFNISSINAMTMEEVCCLVCPFFCGAGPLCILEGCRYLEKARSVEKAREERESTPTIEEGITHPDADERLPYGALFSEAYPSIRRKQGYACITIGTAMSLSACYTTYSLACALNNNNRME